MKIRGIALNLVGALAVAALAIGAPASPAPPTPARATAYIVESRGGMSAAEAVRALGGRVTRDLPIIEGVAAE